MTRTEDPTVTWFNAYTLEERKAILDRLGLQPRAQAPDSDLWERWRSLPPFQDRELFEARLAAAGLTAESFAQILATPAEKLAGELPSPPWTDPLEVFPSETDDSALFDLAPSRGEESSPFLELVRPLLLRAFRQLREAMEAAGGETPWDTEKVARTLFSHLTGRVTMFLRRTLVLELQIAHLEESLQGDTPEERFRDFVQRIADPETGGAMLRHYPVLTRQIVQCTEQWVDFAREFVGRYTADWREIHRTFGAAPESRLVEARPGAGDSHRDGRSVVLLTFSCGLKLVYKPRPAGGEMRFQELCEWINRAGFEPPLRTLTLVGREEYGWVEFVEAAPCTDEGEVERFYQRQGAFLALLYLLDANDIHFENILAAGEHPVLIDLETLFHPPMDAFASGLPYLPPGNDYYRGVHQIGLLPQRIWGAGEHEEGVDLSGLGAEGGQFTAQELLDLEGAGTDRMRFIRRRAEIPEMDHSPRLGGERIHVTTYRDAITAGFTRLYRILLEGRGDLLSDQGPLMAFGPTEIRVIFRSTLSYTLLLAEGFHPDVLQEGLERDLLFDRLWAEVPTRPYLAPLIPSEQRDLHRADIPLFYSRPDSRHLWDARGHCLEDHLPESGLERARRKLRSLGEADLARQRWLIETSLDALPQPGERLRRTTYPFQAADEEAAREDLLAAARSVGERLEELAFRGPQGEASWSIVETLGDRHWAYGPAEPNLYGGLAGITLFLAQLGAVLEEDRFTELARGGWRTLRYQLDTGLLLLPGVGGFTGWGGIAYTAGHLGALWGEEVFFEEAERILDRLPEQIAQDEQHDIVGGAAGCLLSLISLYQQRPSTRILDAALQCGERLAANSRPMERGCGWVLSVAGARPLAGLSHGAAGIALALLKLAHTTGEERFHRLALEALKYERSLFVPAAGNWVDLREGERPEEGLHREGQDFVVGWCHGAPGIGLGRVAALPYLEEPEIEEEIDIALRTTLEDGFGSNHSLCHGDLGNLEFLLLLSEARKDLQLRSHTYRLAQGILDSIAGCGWLYGYPAKVEPLGLMVGLAGIGFGLLRLAEPDRVPSVLVLNPPT